MVTTIYDLKVTAGNINFPLRPLFVYANSDMSLRILNVPKKIGEWEITDIYVEATFPKQMIRNIHAKKVGNVYVCTISGVTKAGKSPDGYSILAYGIDENGDPVGSYTLGRGDITVMEADRSIPTDTSAAYLHILDEAPTSSYAPEVGDSYFDGGSLRIWNGQAWSSSGATKLSQLSNDCGFVTSADVSPDKIINEGKTQYIDYTGAHYSRWKSSTGEYGQWTKDAQYVTDVYVDNEIEDVKLLIPTKVSQLSNDRAYVVKRDVQDMLPTKASQLSNDAGYIQVVPEGTRDPSGLKQTVKTSWLTNDSGFITTADVPTKVSELQNDAGYLSSHQSLSGYATQTWVEGKGYLTAHQSLEEYAKKNELPTKTSDLTNDSGFITSADIPEVDATKVYNEAKTQYISGDKKAYQLSTYSGLGWSIQLDPNDPDPSAHSITVNETYDEGAELGYKWGYEVYDNGQFVYDYYNDERVVPPYSVSFIYNDGQLFGSASRVNAQMSSWVEIGTLATESQIPTKTSQLTNDSNFLTSHQSLEEYAKKNELPTKTSDLTNDSNYAAVTLKVWED